MATTIKNNARLDVGLSDELKRIIEQAAARLGQSVNEFAVSTLVRTAQDVIQQHEQTKLSNRDRDIFVKILDQVDAQPNEALHNAAEQYKEQMG